MLYGLLVEGALVEQQESTTMPTAGAAAEDEASGWLGMEAWVCCESVPAPQAA